jgi:asparagine synthase (glutamine-hydrolysing)
MSAVAGILRLSGAPRAPIDARVARALIDAMPHRRADDIGVWSDEPVTLAWRWNAVTGAAPSTAPPFVSRDRRLVLVYDGRLDNRDEIRRRLGAPSATSDGQLLVEALAETREPLLPHLVGDFILVAWDRRDRRLLLARDALGVRAAYWARHGDVVWWASELQAMLVAPWYTPAVAEGPIGEQLTSWPVTLHESLFAGIERIPQSHSITIQDARVDARAYWHPPDAVVDRPDAEHADRFHAAFTEAVRTRMRGDVGFHLSGGLDTGSILGVAHGVAGGARALRSFSLVFPGLPSADERDYIDAMVAHFGLCSTTIDPRGVGRDTYLGHVFRYRDTPDSFNGEPIIGPTLQAARDAGFGAVISGHGGDYWLAGNASQLAMLLRQGRLRELWREMHREHPGTPWRDLWAHALLPNVPRGVKRRFKPLADRWRRPEWIQPAFARRIDLIDRLRESDRRAGGIRDPVVCESVTRFWSGESAYLIDRQTRSAEYFGVDVRFPFLDRRVVEVTMALPDDQRVRDGVTKFVLRQAVGASLPPLVRDRTGKAEATDLLPIAVLAIEPDGWEERLLVVDAGWVDHAVIRRYMDELRRGRSRRTWNARHLYALWSVFGVEAWLRNERQVRGSTV